MRPPRVATWLLTRFVRHVDPLVGDLREEWAAGRGRIWYWRQVLITVGVAGLKEAGCRGRRIVYSLATGWTINTSPKALLSAFGFVLALAVVTSGTSPIWHTVVRMEIWAHILAVLVMSIVMVVRMVRRRRIPHDADVKVSAGK